MSSCIAMRGCHILAARFMRVYIIALLQSYRYATLRPGNTPDARHPSQKEGETARRFRRGNEADDPDPWRAGVTSHLRAKCDRRPVSQIVLDWAQTIGCSIAPLRQQCSRRSRINQRTGAWGTKIETNHHPVAEEKKKKTICQRGRTSKNQDVAGKGERYVAQEVEERW
ncbi:hypothetical protein VTO42DRAFT_7213 [Malbranchea cinnamomea]